MFFLIARTIFTCCWSIFDTKYNQLILHILVNAYSNDRIKKIFQIFDIYLTYVCPPYSTACPVVLLGIIPEQFCIKPQSVVKEGWMALVQWTSRTARWVEFELDFNNRILGSAFKTKYTVLNTTFGFGKKLCFLNSGYWNYVVNIWFMYISLLMLYCFETYCWNVFTTG